MSDSININGLEIAIKQINQEDYISLTDIAKQRDSQRPTDVIRAWLANEATEDFLELWEKLHNPNFKDGHVTAFKGFRRRQKRLPTVKEYLATGAIGIVSKPGRYGGTYAHTDLAFEFASWLSPSFKLLVIKDYQKLKAAELERQSLEWSASRFLSKVNYPIQTAAIEEVSRSLPAKAKSLVYASEADLINYLVFGQTAKQWRAANPNAKGNIRDVATADENILVANLESFNAQLIRKGASQEAREQALADMLEFQLSVFSQKYLPG